MWLIPQLHSSIGTVQHTSGGCGGLNTPRRSGESAIFDEDGDAHDFFESIDYVFKERFVRPEEQTIIYRLLFIT